jgi:DnaJ-class molecular chaperone
MSTKADLIEDQCVACNGTGKVIEAHPKRTGQPKINPPDCPVCHGTGRVKKSKQP